MATFNIVLRRRGVWPQWRNGEGWKLVEDDGNTVIPRELSNGTGDPSRLEKVVDMAIEEAMQQHPEGRSLSEISQAVIPKLSEHDRMQLLAEAIGTKSSAFTGKRAGKAWTSCSCPASKGLGRHAHYATVFPAPRLVFLSYIADDLTLYLATTPELFLSRRLKLALSDRRFSRRQEFVDEAGKRVPIREFVVARHVRNLTALHDDKLDDLSLKIVVLAAAQGSAQQQDILRLPVRCSHEAIYIRLRFVLRVFQDRRQADGYECCRLGVHLLPMCHHEVAYVLLMAFLVDRCRNDNGVESRKIKCGRE